MGKSADTEPKTLSPRSRRLVGGGRTIDQKEQDLAVLSQLLAAGRTHQEIADHLCELRKDPAWITRSNVTRDADLLLRRWRALSTNEISEWKGRELAKLDAIERRAWEVIDRVEGKTTTLYNVRKIKADKGKNLQSGHGGKKETTNVGHWLHMIRWTCERRAKILGIDAPLKIEGGEGGGIGGLVGSAGMVQLNINVGTLKSAADLSAFEIRDLPTIEDEEHDDA